MFTNMNTNTNTNTNPNSINSDHEGNENKTVLEKPTVTSYANEADRGLLSELARQRAAPGTESSPPCGSASQCADPTGCRC
jgi:hypothetical protein